MARTFLVHWDDEDAQELAERLRGWGHEVAGIESDDGGRAVERILDEPPQAVVIDLDRLASHGRETAHALRQTRPGRLLPIVFVGGDPDRVRKVRAVVPDGVFTSPDGLEQTLADL